VKTESWGFYGFVGGMAADKLYIDGFTHILPQKLRKTSKNAES
jgi:hypothetical protein